MIEWLGSQLSDLGARTEIFHDESGHKANLFATIGPDTDGGIVLSGHSDVVPVAEQDWTSDPFEMVERDGALFGRGACDMKGFIACAMAMAPVFAARDLKRPVHFAFTYDEEVGCIGGQALVSDLKTRGIAPGIAIIGEPTGMQIIEGHKGCCEYTTHFHGLEGHGSAPDRGVNAAEYAVRYVTRLMELREEMKTRAPRGSRFDPPWTTMNIGGIHGGVAHNVIAGRAEVEWEFRPVTSEDMSYMKEEIAAYVSDTLLPAMRAVDPRADIQTETIGEVAGLEPMAANAARDLVAELTGANGVDVVPFATEAGLFQEMGMDVVVCGPGSIDQAHKADEYVTLDQMSRCLDMLEGLARRLS
ncbi:acetylornithine deacetylase [Poseidonocella pacifica]|uniref:Acetylornithine deacetylase n=2 Tax=Poseidonocella pacifica TaxID=871651 RepID=A0A1I0XZB9_9RHOB|nr:acetylornithine deacetylase [Poseidonocella pacifica]